MYTKTFYRDQGIVRAQVPLTSMTSHPCPCEFVVVTLTAPWKAEVMCCGHHGKPSA